VTVPCKPSRNPKQGDALIGAAALNYAAAGMAIFLVGPNKAPLTRHGHKDATTDPELIAAWSWKWPGAQPAWAVANDTVVTDIDCKRGRNVRDFERLAGLPVDDIATPQATTPSGGRHLFFRTDGQVYRNVVGLAGTAIDVKTIGGYVVLPDHHNGRRWVEGKPRELAPAPEWLEAALCGKANGNGARPATRIASVSRVDAEASIYSGPDSRYGAATLERICADIKAAPNGLQEKTFSAGAFKIGLLIGARELAEPAAIMALIDASLAMPSYDPRRPWTHALIKYKVRRGIEQGKHQRWDPDAWLRGLI
jgi:putative DNA primase/helicase